MRYANRVCTNKSLIENYSYIRMFQISFMQCVRILNMTQPASADRSKKKNLHAHTITHTQHFLFTFYMSEYVHMCVLSDARVICAYTNVM